MGRITQTVLTADSRADGQLLATAGETEGLVRLWDLTAKSPRGKTIQVMPSGLPWLNPVAFSPGGRHLFISDPNGLVHVLRLAKPGEEFRIPKTD